MIKKKETKVELVRKWIKNHNTCGSNSWWDGEVRYNLTAQQIVNIANYLYRKRSEE